MFFEVKLILKIPSNNTSKHSFQYFMPKYSNYIFFSMFSL